MADTTNIAWYEKLFNFLDGKKTVIGGAMVWASATLPMNDTWKGILYWGGSFLGGIGVVDKVRKGELGKLDNLPSGLRRNK